MNENPSSGLSAVTVVLLSAVIALGMSMRTFDLHGSHALIVILAFVVFGAILVAKLMSDQWSVREGSRPAVKGKPVCDPATRAMADACRTFYRFLQELDRTPRCRRELEETLGLDNVPSESDHFTISTKLAFLVFCDLRDVFTRLGHSVRSLRNREGIGYAMMVYLLVCKDADLDCFCDYEQRSRILKAVEDLARSNVGNVSIEGHENELRFALLLGQLHHEQDWVNRYATYLYRWASLIAKGDRKVTPAESEVLESIMAAISKKEERKMPEATSYGEGGLEALDALIGLTPVKSEVRKLASFIDIQRQREKSGLKAAPVSYHCVFTGNPGTGKTTVARILAEIYREMGVVKKGHLIETDRSGLIGEYVGQTAVKTNAIIDSALDGVLFIDEAYSLIQGGDKDYGREAIATLLKRMEDDRNRLVVILAGYTDEMKQFIDSNPGLQSRFNRYIEFPDYNAKELAEIFLKKTADCQYTCDKDVRASIVDIMERAVATKDRNFGNARFVRNLFENAIQRQAVRLSTQSPLTPEMLAELTLHDLGFAYAN